MGIGGRGGGAYANGRLHYVAYYDGYLVSASEHACMYTKLKCDGIIPVSMSSTTAKTKIIMECETKALYSSVSDMGAGRSILSIGGAYGSGSATKNYVYITTVSNAAFRSAMYEDTDATVRHITSGAKTDHNQWHKHQFTLDLGNSARSSYLLDEISQTLDASMTGAGNSLSFLDSLLRVGQPQSALINGDLDIRNIKLFLEYRRPRCPGPKSSTRPSPGSTSGS